jgi:hypothetical protein
MLIRGIGALALIFSLNSVALADSQSGIMHRVSCSMVRFYVAKYSATTAEMWARGHGATDADIEAARRCLNRDRRARTAEAERGWFAR